ncbi:MAG: hypothetical protein KDD47_22615, partial [Acidobacteria bacterium]|nr:hypothetical protein [Acidobacteriota bacterium]
MIREHDSEFLPAGAHDDEPQDAELAGELIEDIYTLSPVQQGMLFHILSTPDQGLYFDQTVLAVSGALDEEALFQAWREVLHRHPALRTSFLWDGLSKPVQVVHRQVPLDYRTLDWRRVEPQVQKVQFEVLLEEDRQRGLDLSSPPLLRIHLVRMAKEQHMLLWSVSHLVADGWCSAILIDEVVSLYEAFRHQRRPDLPRRTPYREYVAWLKRQDLEAAEHFWKEMFDGLAVGTRVKPDIASRSDGPCPTFRREGL